MRKWGLKNLIVISCLKILPHNKRMQADRLKRYALAPAADARRYVAKIQYLNVVDSKSSHRLDF